MSLTFQDILDKLPRQSSHSIALKDLLKSLKLSKSDRKELKKILRAMIRDGQIVRHRGGRYSLPHPYVGARADKIKAGNPPNPPKADGQHSLYPYPHVTGTLSAHPDGYGFVIPDTDTESALGGETDIYISPRAIGDAMDGDRVRVQIQAIKANGRREGIITQILERAHHQVVGRFERGKGFGFVIPQNPKIHHDVYIAPELTLDAKEGDLVVAEFLAYPTPHRNPQGRIIRILGTAGDPGIDTEMIIEEFLLPRTFPEECLVAAEALPLRVDSSMIRHRRDLRSLKTVTIDGERARDFDDAISIEAKPEAGHFRLSALKRARFRLWVHIADVAHYVGWDKALDLEARKRGNSVYFPDRVIPMLPEWLSNGVCSLNPHEDRLTLTVEMLFDGVGTRLGYEIYESVIRSQERMTYTQVKEILLGESPELQKRYAPLVEDFKAMEELCEILRKRRMERGSIDFDLPEPEIILDIQGQTTQILKEERNIAHRIIEEFMLAANETVAQHLTDLHIPMIYRVHEEPDPAKMMDLNALLEGFGLYVKEIGKVSPKTLQQILEQVRDRSEQRLIHTVLLRSMKQARYSSTHTGHFGLATDCYTHFTSPIRRYPDLVIHRLVKDVLRNGHRAVASQKVSVLSEIARHSSERERIAMEAERKVVDIKKARFMADKIGEIYSGHISGVVPFGFFVELDEIFVEGLVPLASLQDDHYLYREAQHSLVGVRRRRTYRLGDPVRVKVEKVDLIRYQIDFSLADRPVSGQRPLDRRKPGRPRGKRGSKRRRR
jgi:ribonuclease R